MNSAATPPRRIILATDLSCRCDRALDRAVQLAEEWGAELIAAYVVDPATSPQFGFDHGLASRPPSWRRLPSPVERMRWRLKRDLAGASDAIRPIVEEGDPAETLLAIADREGCDLIVTGIARDETLGRMLVGSTVNRIVRGAEVPVLVVRDRAAHPYRSIVVATDFSDASMQALLGTAAFLPGRNVTLFHGYDIPFSGILTDRDFTGELRSMETDLRQKVLADPRIDPALRERIDIVIEHGQPEALLDCYVKDQHVDLTVIGSHGRGALFDALIGSTAKRLLENLEGDLLIVRYRPEPD